MPIRLVRSLREEREMQCRPEKTKSGKIRYRYRYWKGSKLVTIKQKDLPYKPENEAQAEALRRQLEAQYEAEKAEERLSENWHEKYYNYSELYDIFAAYRMRKAKHSYRDKLSYFRNYVLKYFLEIESGLENLNQWRSKQESFFEWLITRPKMRGQGFLAKQTVNHILTEYNVFMDYMRRKGYIKERCEIELLPKSELAERGPEWVIQDQEQLDIVQRLKAIDEISADVFLILLRTGMRINELLSVEISSIKKGEIPHTQLAGMIKQAFGGKKVLCYVLLDKQLDKEGEVKPLKSRSTASLKYARYVPILDKEVYNVLVKHIKRAKERRDDYLFFNVYPYPKLNSDLKKAYGKTDYKPIKTSHACRHTYATYLGGKDLTGTLQKLILGHDAKTAARYNHVHETLMAQLANEDNNVDEWDFIGDDEDVA